MFKLQKFNILSNPKSLVNIFKYKFNAISHVQRRNVYWPPPVDKRSQLIELPSGKKCFVFMGKRDADGKYEPVLCFIDRNGDKLIWFNAEEIQQFEKLIPRLFNYIQLWEMKKENSTMTYNDV
ncbi:hypothetical protein BdWA1_002066 [Babesia duncani]|uniref:Uncharacterized protein n=1 Tax=Babesia duncani TaxID=323732 RepID=A0AAD9PLW3_9APIC|nr:hypothetical protein BdWA1_002066 [Babesia duncani]